MKRGYNGPNNSSECDFFMATWITHLRLAENLLALLPGLDPAAFAMGNLGPDSGVPDAAWETFDPPSAVTHFWPPSYASQRLDPKAGPSLIRCADLDFYRQYLAPLPRPPDDAELFSFRLGYFFHLVTDNLWHSEVGRPTVERHADRFAADKGFIWEVKRDWYALDLAYVQEHPEHVFWTAFMPSSYDRDYLPFLPGAAVRHSQAYIKDFYQRSDAAMRKRLEHPPFRYFSAPQWEAFLTLATQRLDEVYHRLWVDGADAGVGQTALGL